MTSFFSFSPISAAGIRFTNQTVHAIAVTIKAVGLVFAADLPRIFFLSAGESFLFDAGFGGIEGITVSICDMIAQFDFTLAGSTGIRKCILTVQEGGNLSLDVGQTGFLPPLGQFNGKIKKSEQRCLCLTPAKQSTTNK
jgi:hypothetical protein